MDGMIGIYKEKGYTSHDVVARLRGILHQKKIGHTGTLDPEAEGVLPVCLGKATKLCELLANKDKIYIAVCQLGVVTDTQDMTGKLLQENKVQVAEKEVKECLASFLGEYWQLPPMYSALKVNGRKLYELAREGISVERKKRKVVFYEIELLEYNETESCFTMRVHCSSGTYIRTLCHDVGEKLGCGGAMKELVRTRAATFCIESAIKLAQVEQLCKEDRLGEYVLPIDALFPDYRSLYVAEHGDKALHNGNILKESDVQRIEEAKKDSEAETEDNDTVLFLVYDSKQHFTAIYRRADKGYRPVKMF